MLLGLLRCVLISLTFLWVVDGGILRAEAEMEAPMQQYEVLRVVHLKVEIMTGERGDVDAILAKMKTKEGEIFSQGHFDQDLKALSQEYDRIEPIMRVMPGGLVIELKIWPRPILRSIVFRGNERLEAKALRNALGIALYTPFNREKFNIAFRKLQDYYIKQGFFESELDFSIAEDSKTEQVDITIDIKEGRAGYIQEIIFKDFLPEEEADILELIATKKYSIFTSWLTQEGSFSPEAIERDKLIILNYLQSRGFADADIAIAISEVPQQHRIVVTIAAARGARYHLGEMTFEGNTLFSTEEIKGLLNIPCGAAYSPDKLREAMYYLTHLYGKRGYIDAFINYEARPRTDAPIYDIHVFFDEGQQYRVGLIKILGNEITKSRVILHETLLLPGEIFNIEKLKKSEERLQNIGYFKSVHVYGAHSDSSSFLPDCYRDVYIEVEESNTGHIGFSMGYSTAESLFGELKLTERNFNLLGLPEVFSRGLCALRGGGEYAQLSFTTGYKTSRYLLSWTKPFFMDTPWSVGFDMERSISRYISDAFDVKATSFTLHAGYPINAFTRFDWHYRITNSYIHSKKGEKCPEGEKHIKGIVVATGVGLLYDSTDRPLEPTCGFKSKVDFEVASFWGDHSFLKLCYLNSYYLPVWDTGVLLFRADFKFIEPLQPSTPVSLPLDERFFLGGDQTVRGFRPYRLGPKCPDDDPRGGISLQYYSVEYSFPVLPKVEGFFFTDAGQLSLERWHLGGLNVASGFGARVYVLPNAPPLTVGVGYPWTIKKSTDVKRFFLTLGGRF